MAEQLKDQLAWMDQRIKDAKERSNIANEILKTETIYSKTLDNICAFFLDPLRDKKDVISEDMRRKIFPGALKTLSTVHQDFLGQIKERVAKWDDKSKMGDLILKMVPFFKLYPVYVSEFEQQMKTLRETKTANPAFSAFLQAQFKALNDPSNDLASLLVTPVQRIPRYLMLIKSLLKHTWAEHEDYADLKSAEEQVAAIAVLVDQRAKEAENVQKMYQVDTILNECDFPLLDPQRKFLGNVLVLVERSGAKNVFRAIMKPPKTKEYCLFVFSDIVIWAKPNPDRKTFQFRIRVPLLGCSVEDDADKPQVLRLLVSADEHYTVTFKNEDERKTYSEMLVQTIRENNRKAATLRPQKNPSVGVAAGAAIASGAGGTKGKAGGAPAVAPQVSLANVQWKHVAGESVPLSSTGSSNSVSTTSAPGTPPPPAKSPNVAPKAPTREDRSSSGPRTDGSKPTIQFSRASDKNPRRSDRPALPALPEQASGPMVTSLPTSSAASLNPSPRGSPRPVPSPRPPAPSVELQVAPPATDEQPKPEPQKPLASESGPAALPHPLDMLELSATGAEDYMAPDSEVRIERGESLTVLDRSGAGEQWYVRDARGKCGRVPSAMVRLHSEGTSFAAMGVTGGASAFSDASSYAHTPNQSSTSTPTLPHRAQSDATLYPAIFDPQLYVTDAQPTHAHSAPPARPPSRPPSGQFAPVLPNPQFPPLPPQHEQFPPQHLTSSQELLASSQGHVGPPQHMVSSQEQLASSQGYFPAPGSPLVGHSQQYPPGYPQQYVPQQSQQQQQPPPPYVPPPAYGAGGGGHFTPNAYQYHPQQQPYPYPYPYPYPQQPQQPQHQQMPPPPPYPGGPAPPQQQQFPPPHYQGSFTGGYPPGQPQAQVHVQQWTTYQQLYTAPPNK